MTSSDPFPWADQSRPTVEAALDEQTIPTRNEPGTLVLSGAVIDLHAADLLLDTLANEPARRTTVGNMRDTLVDVVRSRAGKRHEVRPDEIRSSTDVRIEAVGLADDAEALDALAGAFTAAAKEARVLAGDLIDDVPRARASFKVADGHGFELTVRREPRRELSVSVDDVVDVVVAHAIAARHGSDGTVFYGSGVRDGIDAFREVLASTPAFRSTALDSLATRLENAGEDNLAKRLRKAYGRVDKGEPAVKIERKPIVDKGATS